MMKRGNPTYCKFKEAYINPYQLKEKEFKTLQKELYLKMMIISSLQRKYSKRLMSKLYNNNCKLKRKTLLMLRRRNRALNNQKIKRSKRIINQPIKTKMKNSQIKLSRVLLSLKVISFINAVLQSCKELHHQFRLFWRKNNIIKNITDMIEIEDSNKIRIRIRNRTIILNTELNKRKKIKIKVRKIMIKLNNLSNIRIMKRKKITRN